MVRITALFDRFALLRRGGYRVGESVLRVGACRHRAIEAFVHHISLMMPTIKVALLACDGSFMHTRPSRAIQSSISGTTSIEGTLG